MRMHNHEIFSQHGLLPAEIRTEETEAVVVVEGDSRPHITTAMVTGGPGHALLAMCECSTCGSDWRKLEEQSFSFPKGACEMILGHEPGVAVALESFEIEHEGRSYPAGTTVVPIVTRLQCVATGKALTPMSPADECPICGPYVTPGSSRGNGFLSQKAFYPKDLLIPVDDGLAKYVVLGEPTAVIEKALDKLSIAHSNVAVVGLGPIGMLTSGMLTDAGHEVVGVDLVAPDHPRARAFRELVGGQYYQIPDARAQLSSLCDVVVEAAGGDNSLPLAATLCKPTGAVLVLGIPEVEKGSDAHKSIASKELTLIGSASTTPESFRHAIETITRWTKTPRRKELLERFITAKRVSFFDAPRAFYEAATGEFLKVIIDIER